MTGEAGERMCLGIPGEVVEILGDRSELARVDVGGVRRAVHIGLLEGEDLRQGDWVLIHVGFALSKIDEEEARTTLRLLDEAGQAYADELAALRESRIE